MLLLLPVLFSPSAFQPTAVLSLPSVLLPSAPDPVAVF